MKRFLILLMVVIAVGFTGCKKTADDIGPSSPGMELKHSEHPIPFNGSLIGVITTVPSDCPGWTGRRFVGEGNVTQMGLTHAVLEYCMRTEFPSPDPGYDAIFKGPGTLTGANGDIIQGYFVGTVVFRFVQGNPNPVSGHIEADAVLYGGTGRFEGAHGLIHGTGEMDFTAGAEVPTTLEFNGTIHYGSEFFEATLSGEQYANGSCGAGSNAYTFSGEGSGTLPGPVSADMTYCATTAFAPPPYPPTLAIGGTNTGTGMMIDSNGDHLNSEFAALYRFTYLPSLMAPTSIVNDAIGMGTFTGGTGVYENATGTFISTCVQTLNLGPGGPQFPAATEFYVIGWLKNPD